jgi:hypothetical protein
MKIEEIKKKLQGQDANVVAPFISHETATSAKGQPYERVSVLVGKRVVEFMMMLSKERKAGYVFKHCGLAPMCPVILTGADLDVRNGFLSASCEAIHTIE